MLSESAAVSLFLPFARQDEILLAIKKALPQP
jgi:hypothetical protein